MIRQDLYNLSPFKHRLSTLCLTLNLISLSYNLPFLGLIDIQKNAFRKMINKIKYSEGKKKELQKNKNIKDVRLKSGHSIKTKN